jgi:peptidoglycan/xylan/chitin deacetylase (PgdA/CDA1 family)
MVSINTSVPIISFTFDDAPKTAFDTGSAILRLCGAKATFFVSMGLLGCKTEVGTIASEEDLLRVWEEGNELGCHTFDHLYTWETTPDMFVESVIRNNKALGRILPGAHFKTFAYPIGVPKPSVKLKLEKHFVCCRGGGQTANTGVADLNLLKSYFIDKRNNEDIDSVKKIIDYNASFPGWLIFATHDITETPSPYGCTPKFFSDVVEHAVGSGAVLLPVIEAFERLRLGNAEPVMSQ